MLSMLRHACRRSASLSPTAPSSSSSVSSSLTSASAWLSSSSSQRQLRCTQHRHFFAAAAADIKVSMAQIKELRQLTDAPISDCKKALIDALATPDPESESTMAQATEWLRKKGIQTAAKKSGRVAAEGLIGAHVSECGRLGALVELNCETDFVAKNDKFRALVDEITQSVVSLRDQPASQVATGIVREVDIDTHVPETQRTAVTELTASIGEKMQLRRARQLDVTNGVLVSYMHNAIALDGAGDNAAKLGRIGVLVGLDTMTEAGDQTAAQRTAATALANRLAMHIAAAAPTALSPDLVDADVVARERAFLTEQAEAPAADGQPNKAMKPEHMQRMIEGRMAKFFEAQCLEQQKCMVMENQDDKPVTVAKVLTAFNKAHDSDFSIAGFVRYQVGDGVEKDADGEDFAAEVAAMAGGK